MGIAFFDLDRTLLTVNSARLWILRERRLGRIGRRDLVRAMGWAVAYRVGITGLEGALEKAAQTMKGKESALLMAETRTFWNEELVSTLRPGARPAIARHRAAGDLVVLLTSSTPYVALLAREALAMDEHLSTRFEEENGILTGRLVEPMCYGEGKRTLAEDFVASRGGSMAKVTFYTDSAADLPLMKHVGMPVCVSPDPRLARHARRRGWRVEDWGEAQRPSAR